MKIHLLSDIHGRYRTFNPLNENDVDVVVLAGDIDNGVEGLYWARNNFPYVPIVYVVGNHELYGHMLQRMYVEMHHVAKELNINLLDNSTVVINNTRFVGATLWTDFELFGRDRLGDALHYSGEKINDFASIRFGTLGFMLPSQTVLLHRVSRDYIEKELNTPFNGRTVVVSHHAPTEKSVHEKFKKDIVSSAFASNLDHLVMKANLWCHGHTHHFQDYYLDNKKPEYGHVISNPGGYSFENSNWNPQLVINL